jgi:type III pantothenate kinase
MHYIVDQGNTLTKVALFEGSKLLRSFQLTDHQLESFQPDDPCPCFFSSVRSDAESITSKWKIAEKFDREKHRLPFSLNYENASTLGTDRIADVTGARFLHPHTNLLVIDAGTCVTYNLLIADVFTGGAISPGMHMRMRAMHTFTGKLPLVEPVAKPELIAINTHQSLQSGAMHGLVSEIDGMIKKFCSHYGTLSVILTGGDMSFLAENLESPIFAIPFLTLIGLNEIYLLNR